MVYSTARGAYCSISQLKQANIQQSRRGLLTYSAGTPVHQHSRPALVILCDVSHVPAIATVRD